MCVYVVIQSLSCVWLFVTPGTAAHQASLSMGFPRQENRSGFPFPFHGIFLTQGFNLCLLSCIGTQILYCWATGEAPKAFLLFGKFVNSSLGGSDTREWSCYAEHNYVYQQLWKASSYCSVNKTVYRVWLRDKWLIVLDNTLEKARFCIFLGCKICFWLKLWWQTI